MRGFTLIETMTCALIAALLAAIALPGYRGVVLRAHRVEARLALLRIHLLQEQYYIEHLRYGEESGVAGTRTDRYALSIALSDDGQRYVATARPIPGQAQAADTVCSSLSIDESGERSASSETCWR